jgi:hypothetical protein
VTAQNAWGRVTSDGTAYVTTSQGERVVGSWQADEPEEGLAFFVRRFADLETQVTLLEQRLASGATPPDTATATAAKLRDAIANAAAIGDLDGLLARLDALGEVIEKRRAERKAERAAAVAVAKERKAAIVGEAEAIAASTDWRNGSNRLRDLLEEWKRLPRVERSVDDALWHRFSAARTGYTRRRKTHFAEVGEQREAAKAAKQKLVAEARELSTSTDWGATSAAMRDLMTRWKKTGRAPRGVDDELWSQFRAAQDVFFSARDAADAERDAELVANLEVKRAVLVEAEALLPVSDAKAARAALRTLQDRFAAAGKVPRDAVRDVERRMRAVEQAVEAAQEEAWRRSNPEARARAESTVHQLLESMKALERDRDKARTEGNEKAAAEAEEAMAARRAWLEQAQATLAEFSG